MAGQPDLAIEHLETALRPLTEIGSVYFCKRQFGEATSKLLLARAIVDRRKTAGD